MCLDYTVVAVVLGPFFCPGAFLPPGGSNAGAQLLPEAEARDERTLEAVSCSALLALARTP
jgi:hypothetical protein